MLQILQALILRRMAQEMAKFGDCPRMNRRLLSVPEQADMVGRGPTWEVQSGTKPSNKVC